LDELRAGLNGRTDINQDQSMTNGIQGPGIRLPRNRNGLAMTVESWFTAH